MSMVSLLVFGCVASLIGCTVASYQAGPECALILNRDEGEGASYGGENDGYSSTTAAQYLSRYGSESNGKERALTPYGKSAKTTCITFADINDAVHRARLELGNYIPAENAKLNSDYPKPVHISVAADIVIEATKILARKFGLSRQAILFALPRVDTQRTAIRDICPAFLKPVKCDVNARYRTLTGMCNNLDYPSWGSARSAMVRFLPPDYADGVMKPRVGSYGEPLPGARVVSFVVHHDVGERDNQITMLFVSFGQLIDHDMTASAATTDEEDVNVECCKYSLAERHPQCYPIDIPKDDPFFKFFHQKCMDFTRVMPGLKPYCPLGPRSQINTISAYLDANFIYGSNKETASRLRTFHGGLLKSTSLGEYRKDLLPMKTGKDADKGCERESAPRKLFCFIAGDERANEQIPLTVMHTLFMREHNRIARELYRLAPNWDDERLYQETRRIVGGMLQHIIFNEYLPITLGRDTMARYGLDLRPDGYYTGYDSSINAGIRAAFQAAAFRFGHSILPDVFERYNKYHEKIDAIRLSRVLRQPYSLYTPGMVDSYVVGLINQEANRMDAEITTEVTNHLFEKPSKNFGLDLASLNIQRGREMGVPGYNAYRQYCGLPRAKNFYDLAGTMDNRTISRFATLFKSVDDIDLFSGGLSEYPLSNAVVGPTFACIIGEQFANVRRGDRFWYENQGQPGSFSTEELYEIRQARLSRIICDNTDDLQTIQLYPMLIAEPYSNPRVNCADIRPLDLSKFVNAYKSSS